MTTFLEISFIIVLAALICSVMRFLHQPMIMGYIITGLVVGPIFLNIYNSTETVDTFSKFGVAILLFIVGINLSPSVAREVGKISILAGTGQILVTSLVGWEVANLLGFNSIEAWYIAATLTFSSTIIVLKLLSDSKELDKLYAKIVIGILLVQDIAATIVLVAVNTYGHAPSSVGAMTLLLGKGLLLLVLLLIISYFLLPRLGDFSAQSQEFLFLFSIAWGLGIASLFSILGFSLEIGALCAGVALSSSPYAQEASAKLKPLRDFFLILFFVFLGTQVDFANLTSVLLPVILLSSFVILFEPLIIIAIMLGLGYNKKISFLTGTALGQMSEFSLILALLGKDLGHISNQTLAIITLVAVLSISISTYVIKYAKAMYPFFVTYLTQFEKKTVIPTNDLLAAHEVVLFGVNRVGYDFLNLFKTLGQKFLAIDYNPMIVKELTTMGFNCRYGDADDAELLEELNLGDTKMVISTIPEFETSSYLVKRIKQQNQKVIVIVISYNVDEALKLYDLGATYVILPHFISGQFAAMLAAKHWFNIDTFHKERDTHVSYLKQRVETGHTHPKHLKTRLFGM